MNRVVQFPREKRRVQTVNQQLVQRIRELLAEAISGEMTSLAYMGGNADGTHRYDMVGEYLEDPEKVFVPATKAMFALCIHINDKGRKV